MKTSDALEQKLSVLVSKGIIVPRTENNKSLKVSYKGAGTIISPKWNVKIYNSGSVVCTDEKVLDDILHDKLKEPDKSKGIIQCDDAGWGSPLCSVMVGAYDGERLLTDVIDISYFQEDKFRTQEYLGAYAEAGMKLIHEFKAFPDTHRVEICTGHINGGLKDRLRKDGFDVRVVEITGVLQDKLEGLFRDYVKKETGQDLAYDPKGMDKLEISRRYYRALEWGKKNVPHLLKSGWKSMHDNNEI
jgi:hypothetical protein